MIKSPGLEYALSLGFCVVARQTVKAASTATSRRPVLPSISHDGVEGGEPAHAKIRRWVAMQARSAEYGVQSVLAVAGTQPVPARVLCRRWRRRRNIRIASAAADCRRLSRHCEAARGAGTEAPRQSPIEPGEIRVVREIGIAHERADADAAIGQMFECVEPRRRVTSTRRLGRVIPPFIRSAGSYRPRDRQRTGSAAAAMASAMVPA